MRNVFSILAVEKFKRIRRFCAQKPLLILGMVVSIGYAAYCYRGSLGRFGSRWIDLMVAVVVVLIMKWSLWGAACHSQRCFRFCFCVSKG